MTPQRTGDLSTPSIEVTMNESVSHCPAIVEEAIISWSVAPITNFSVSGSLGFKRTKVVKSNLS